MKERCFIVIPFQPFFEDFFEHGIKPALEDIGVEAFISKDVKGIKWPFQKINEAIETSRFCIADITGLNANVMYELGYAAALKKPTIILWDESKLKKESMPFDVNYFHGEPYNTEADKTWSSKLAKRIKDHIKHDLDNLVEASASNFLKTNEAGVLTDFALDDLGVLIITALEVADAKEHEISMSGMKDLMEFLGQDRFAVGLALDALCENGFVHRSMWYGGNNANKYYNTSKAKEFLRQNKIRSLEARNKLPEDYSKFRPTNDHIY